MTRAIMNNETFVDSTSASRRVRVNYMDDKTVQLVIYAANGALCDIAYFDADRWREFMRMQNAYMNTDSWKANFE